MPKIVATLKQTAERTREQAHETGHVKRVEAADGHHIKGADRQKMVARLRNQIERIENHPALDAPMSDSQSAGRQVRERPLSDKQSFDGFAVPGAGLLHEIWVDETRNSGAALGFALGQARQLTSTRRPVVLWMQLAHDAAQTGLPYAHGLACFGFDPEALIICRLANVNDLLWAVEEAAACPAVAAIITDNVQPAKALNFTNSRRLSLRAARKNTSIFMVRYGREREVSAVNLRWHVAPLLSVETAFDARAPGRMRWRVRLEKGQLQKELRHKERLQKERLNQAFDQTDRRISGKRAGDKKTEVNGQTDWILNWTKHGFTREYFGARPSRKFAAASALSGSLSALVGNRLSETA